MTMIADLVQILLCLLRAVRDAVFGRRRQRYATSVEINAPLDVVWSAASARKIVFEGPPRIEIATALRPGTTNIYEGTASFGDRVVPMAYREVESRPREGLLIEILQEGSDPSVAPGRDHFVACTFVERAGKTLMTTVHELTHGNFLSRVLIPLGARFNARRLRDYCEAQAGTAGFETSGSKLRAAAVTGTLTYASFMYLFDWKFAALLLALLIIHEAGHALAMRWVGLPVKGVFFIPFFGGVAVSAEPHRNEAERGFVALMGPGFSLVTTAAFAAGAYLTGEEVFAQLAFLSAILNGINLAPVLPLDGGHVLDSALSSSDPELKTIINMLALIVGAGVSVYLEWYVLTALLVLTAPALLASSKRTRPIEPISNAGRNWLVAGYLATIAFYLAVAAHFLA